MTHHDGSAQHAVPEQVQILEQKHHWRLGQEPTWVKVVGALMLIIAIIWGLIGWAKLRDYNLITYPQGNVAEVLNKDHQVEVDGILKTRYPEYCNKGVTVEVERWLDIWVKNPKTGDQGWFAGVRVNKLEFKKELATGCSAPEDQEVPLPIEARLGGTYRFRNIQTYKVPLNTVTVLSYTEGFKVVRVAP